MHKLPLVSTRQPSFYVWVLWKETRALPRALWFAAFMLLPVARAMGYAAGALEYHFCDSAMNFVMGLTRYEVPTFAWSVYSAFDEGEFYHAGDSQEVDPAEKYTRPWIIRVLREAGFDIPAA